MSENKPHNFDRLNSKQRSGEIYRLSENMDATLEIFLLKEFTNERNLTGIAFGFVTVSWVIAVVLLEKGSNQGIYELKKLVVKYWNETEIEDFRSYICGSTKIYNKWNITPI